MGWTGPQAARMLVIRDEAAHPMTPIAPPRFGVYLAVLQFFFALTWTVYVIYLPQLAAQAGLPRSAVPWLLMLDQLVFLLADYACGVASDRMARLHARLGPAVLGATLLSCLAFLLLPLVAPQGSAAVFVALTVVWAIGSSALRAPPLNLIGRYAAQPAQPGLLAMLMLGLGVAAAVSPYLGTVLRDIDPRWPFGLASLALALTCGGMIAAERALQGQAAARPSAELRAPLRLPWGPCLLVAVLATVAFQLHVFVNSGALYRRHADAAALQHLAPVFWVGFNLGLWPASRAVQRWGAPAVLAAAGLAAACAASAAHLAGALTPLVAAQGVAGLAWAGVLMAAFSTAMALGHTGAEGRCCGALSSTLALAALLRMGLVATGAATLPVDHPAKRMLEWLPALAWLLATLLMLALWRRLPRAPLATRVGT